MKIVENVFEMAKSFMENSKYVRINDFKIDKLTKRMREDGIVEFPLPELKEKIFDRVLIELVASSINYCYWYGRHDIRPNGVNSSKMYEIVMNKFNDFHISFIDYNIKGIKENLIINRFPLIEERCKHLDELIQDVMQTSKLCRRIVGIYNGVDNETTMEMLLLELITTFPGFASDIFLKRASLFFIQMYRTFGLFEKELYDLHVPADYQIPKMLEHFQCIEYHPTLKLMIEQRKLIPKNSLEECEIRSATILAMQKLSILTGWNIADVDTYLFTQRHECKNPFHLTVTTDY